MTNGSQTIPYDKPFPKDRPLRIVFMGTPDFAVPTLKALLEGPHEVVGVYTQPDRPQGRGRKLTPPPIKRVALDAGIPVFQPEKMSSREGLDRLTTDAPDLVIVVAYGKILGPRILAVPPLGSINCHASLLPAYRGAHPIFWALANGEKETGITTMLMDRGLDTGDMLVKKTLSIAPNETFDSLHDRLSSLSAEALLETLALMEKGRLMRTPQDHEAATYAPMLEREQRWIDFTRSAQDVHNWIRALDPKPGAQAQLPDGKTLKLFSSVEILDYEEAAGKILAANSEGLFIACGQGAIRVQELQFPNKRRMTIEQYLAGHSSLEGLTLSSPLSSQSK